MQKKGQVCSWLLFQFFNMEEIGVGFLGGFMVRSEKIIIVDAGRNKCQADRILERFISH